MVWVFEITTSQRWVLLFEVLFSSLLTTSTMGWFWKSHRTSFRFSNHQFCFKRSICFFCFNGFKFFQLFRFFGWSEQLLDSDFHTFLVFQLRSKFNRKPPPDLFLRPFRSELVHGPVTAGNKTKLGVDARMGSSDPGHVFRPRNEEVSTHENVNFCLIILRLRFFSSQSVTWVASPSTPSSTAAAAAAGSGTKLEKKRKCLSTWKLSSNQNANMIWNKLERGVGGWVFFFPLIKQLPVPADAVWVRKNLSHHSPSLSLSLSGSAWGNQGVRCVGNAMAVALSLTRRRIPDWQKLLKNLEGRLRGCLRRTKDGAKMVFDGGSTLSEAFRHKVGLGKSHTEIEISTRSGRFETDSARRLSQRRNVDAEVAAVRCNR